jgi:hypothetical protein
MRTSCVDGVEGVEVVVIRDTRTGRLSAVNASTFLPGGLGSLPAALTPAARGGFDLFDVATPKTRISVYRRPRQILTVR